MPIGAGHFAAAVKGAARHATWLTRMRSFRNMLPIGLPHCCLFLGQIGDGHDHVQPQPDVESLDICENWIGFKTTLRPCPSTLCNCRFKGVSIESSQRLYLATAMHSLYCQ